ncbi:hypothetical protein C8Q70DRAFT_651171 [Cubamyces menziesii]|nr:hypothetical protein C8Q70DRAFT_651171 [Cubamyces menziesii]
MRFHTGKLAKMPPQPDCNMTPDVFIYMLSLERRDLLYSNPNLMDVLLASWQAKRCVVPVGYLGSEQIGCAILRHVLYKQAQSGTTHIRGCASAILLQIHLRTLPTPSHNHDTPDASHTVRARTSAYTQRLRSNLLARGRRAGAPGTDPISACLCHRELTRHRRLCRHVRCGLAVLIVQAVRRCVRSTSARLPVHCATGPRVRAGDTRIHRASTCRKGWTAIPWCSVLRRHDVIGESW